MRAAFKILTQNQVRMNIRRFCSIVSIALLMCYGGSARGAALPASSEAVTISPHMVIDRVVIKFDDFASVRLRSDRLVSLSDVDLSALNALLHGSTVERLFHRSEAEIDAEHSSLESSMARPLVDKNSYYEVLVTDHRQAEDIVNSLKHLPYIECVYAEPMPEPAQDIPPPTPDFAGDQGYLYDPPEGIGADFCWSIPGGTGTGVRIIDIEGNLNSDHEDFGDNVGSVIAGNPVAATDWINHGTATTGEMCADSNEYGITGIAYGSDIDLISIDGLGTAAAIDVAASLLQAGDIILIELHSPGPRYNFATRPDQMGYVPVEYFQANFDAIQMAAARGIVVVEAGGNGYENLDDPLYESRFDRDVRYSRAIIVGAGAPPNGQFGPDRSRLYFSNYGSRIDLQGWGKSVVTTGYGGLFSGDGDDDQYYTETFGGTSAASPMIAGAAACLQGIYFAEYGFPLSPDAVVGLLTNTGSLQPNPTEWIGPRPNLIAANQFLPPPGITAMPLHIDTWVVGGQSTIVGVLLTNRDYSSPVDFTIEIEDSLEGLASPGWIEVSPMSGTIASGGMQDLLITLSSDILADTTYNYKGMITVDYGTWSPLRIPVFFDVMCNDTDYANVDSDSPPQPDFEWVDITSIGTRLDPDDFHNAAIPTSALDDGTSRKISIGFPFNFYNGVFTSLYAGVNGGLSFVSDEVNIDGYFADIGFPSPGIDALLAAFWEDLSIDSIGAGHGAIYYYNSSGNDSLVIEYHEVGNFHQIADSMITFEVILTSDHTITFQYLEVGSYGLGFSALVGMSRDEGCRFTEYLSSGAPSSNVLHDSLRVDFIPTYEFVMPSGDTDGSGDIDIDDVVYLIGYIFSGGPAPTPLDVGDCECSGEIDIDDIVYLVAYIFLAGPEPCSYTP